MVRRACIVGHPVAHSRSPMIHGHWLSEYGIDGAYGREDVSPEAFEAFIAELGARGYVGCNVTVPNKEAAFAAATVDDPVGRALRAVNTLWLEDGVLRGMNTDVAGFLASLDADRPGWHRDAGTALVLGAGGASRAIVHALLSRGIGRVRLANRTQARAAEVAALFGSDVEVVAWADVEAAMDGVSILVNTTSLGMKGQPPLDLSLARLPTGALVTDIVYVPLITPLLAMAREAGHPIVDGLRMLLHQAVPGFERWFGVRPSVTPALRALIEADVVAKSG
ncbi:MAG: shikimate dehydrogenase [Labrys sp. (in: a-proteobacteria)]